MIIYEFLKESLKDATSEEQKIIKRYLRRGYCDFGGEAETPTVDFSWAEEIIPGSMKELTDEELDAAYENLNPSEEALQFFQASTYNQLGYNLPEDNPFSAIGILQFMDDLVDPLKVTSMLSPLEHDFIAFSFWENGGEQASIAALNNKLWWMPGDDDLDDAIALLQQVKENHAK